MVGWPNQHVLGLAADNIDWLTLATAPFWSERAELIGFLKKTGAKTEHFKQISAQKLINKYFLLNIKP